MQSLYQKCKHIYAQERLDTAVCGFTAGTMIRACELVITFLSLRANQTSPSNLAAFSKQMR
jgi:hypothetical protein